MPSGRKRKPPSAIYAVSFDARRALAGDLRRLAGTRPGYGYAGVSDLDRDILAPQDAGIWRVDMRTGVTKFNHLPRTNRVQPSPAPNPSFGRTGAKHWFNHPRISPCGRRFLFLRRRSVGAAGPRRFFTCMFTADADGRNLHVVDGFGGGLHLIPRDERHIPAWATRAPRGAAAEVNA